MFRGPVGFSMSDGATQTDISARIHTAGSVNRGDFQSLRIHLLLVYEILIKRQRFICWPMFAVDNDQDVNNG